MSIMSRLLARLFRLPPAETRDIGAEKNLAVELPDGTVLRADRYFPRTLGQRPVFLMRSPYSERKKAGFLGALIAERGFQVLMVSSRGVFGSGGTFDPFLNEGGDTPGLLAWLKRQDWFGGEIVSAGASYHGYT